MKRNLSEERGYRINFGTKETSGKDYNIVCLEHIPAYFKGGILNSDAFKT
jgi:hypothetical protein